MKKLCGCVWAEKALKLLSVCFTSQGAKGRQGENFQTFAPAHTRNVKCVNVHAAPQPPPPLCQHLLPPPTPPDACQLQLHLLAGCSIRACHLITAASWPQPKADSCTQPPSLKVSSRAMPDAATGPESCWVRSVLSNVCVCQAQRFLTTGFHKTPRSGSKD